MYIYIWFSHFIFYTIIFWIKFLSFKKSLFNDININSHGNESYSLINFFERRLLFSISALFESYTRIINIIICIVNNFQNTKKYVYQKIDYASKFSILFFSHQIFSVLIRIISWTTWYWQCCCFSFCEVSFWCVFLCSITMLKMVDYCVLFFVHCILI